MIRKFLLATVIASMAAVTAAPGSAATSEPPGSGKNDAPRTGFEESGGAEWTTHEQELKFLDAVEKGSVRAEIDVVGKTAQDRPLHLVQLGAPDPATRTQALKRPTVLFIGSQHGNEPAGREASLMLLRDLAFTDDKGLEALLEEMTVLVIPTANPDGRAANTRGNSARVDINRDHLNLATLEAQTMAAVVRDWKPDVVLDLHEYGPSIPGVYDDEILYLWPRNLNVDEKVYELARVLGDEYVAPGAEEKGYSADEYGQYELADNDIHQSAGNEDPAIARNATGLRHGIGLLVESAVTRDPRNGPNELIDEAAVRLRRVDSHYVVALEALRFMAERGAKASKETSLAHKRATAEGRSGDEPFYFGGADNDEPSEDEVAEAPCSYLLDEAQFKKVSRTLGLLGIKARRSGKDWTVSMAQPGRPLIPLLLDERGTRHSVTAEPQPCK